MASTFRHTSAYAASTLLLLSLSTTVVGAGLNAMTYQGCFSSSQPLKDQGAYTYQTSGYCQPICVKQNQAVLATSDGSHCWCGDLVPAANTKVSDSFCNDPCDGYDQEMCGGNGYLSVYLSGIQDNVPSLGQQTNNPSAPSTTTAKPSVVTSVSPGKTVVVTEQASSSTASSHSKSSGGTNVTAIAAGVVVAVVIVSAILAAIFFWLRYRKRKAAEEEYKRTQVSDFMRNGERKPPQTGYSSTSDQRLDSGIANPRNSQGSIADNQDYSRKILRVANPDRSQ